MTGQRPLGFDPIAEARRQWDRREWAAAEEMSAATSIMRAQQLVLATVDRALAPYGLTFARYEVLVLLYFSRTGALPLGKMGDRLMVHPTTITNSIDRLELQGYVRRMRHPTDGRTTLAELTAEGRSAVEQATHDVVATEFGLGSLSRSDLGSLTRVLTRMRREVGDFVPER